MIPAGCKVSEIGKFLRSKILKNGEKVKNLTIVDPYFFSIIKDRPSITQDIIMSIFKDSQELINCDVSDGFEKLTIDDNFEELESIKVIIPKQNYKGKEKQQKKNIEELLKNKSLGKFTKLVADPIENKFHDRFWIINDNKAFIVGASINGMSSKHFYIQDNFLTEADTTTLLCLYQNGKEKDNNRLKDICDYLEDIE